MKSYLPTLDGLRGVAALAVVGSHFENLSGISLHLQHGGVAVDFFFVLSGFVIGQAYEHRLVMGLTWRGYMGLRLERLYPAILGGLIIGLAVAVVAGERLHPAMALQFVLLPVFWGPLLHGGELFPLDGPQWSLFLELAANAVHAATLRWLSTPRLVVVVTLAGAVLIFVSLRAGGLDVGWARGSFWGGPPRVIYGFGMGLLIWRGRACGLKLPAVPYLFIVAGLILSLVRPFPEAGLYAVTDPVIVLVIMPLLVALAVVSPAPRRGAGPVLWLGALSYPLYALHAPMLRAFEVGLDRLSDQEAAVGWALALPATIAFAALFARFCDAPVRAWLRAKRQRAAVG